MRRRGSAEGRCRGVVGMLERARPGVVGCLRRKKRMREAGLAIVLEGYKASFAAHIELLDR